MFDEVIDKILSTIDENEIFTETYPKFSGEGYRAHRIDIKNFHEIKIEKETRNSEKSSTPLDGPSSDAHRRLLQVR